MNSVKNNFMKNKKGSNCMIKVEKSSYYLEK